MGKPTALIGCGWTRNSAERLSVRSPKMAEYDYTKMTDTEFDKILAEILDEMSGQEILSIPGVYCEVAEYFNNEALERWEKKHTEAEV
jgi:hypothetical protein